VISDLGLPDGDGRTLMRELRDRYGLTGIAFSGYGTEEDRRESQEAGFAAHLTKPVTLDALLTEIRRVGGGEWVEG
jgi:CheY-like chemotaxis protein